MSKDDQYKKRLETRFLHVVDDFTYIDPRFVSTLGIEELERIGIELAKANKVFQEVLKNRPNLAKYIRDKKQFRRR